MGVFRIEIETDDDSLAIEDATVEEVVWMEDVPADAPYLICRPLTFPLWASDNQLGRCAGCNQPVQFRPTAHPDIPKVCDGCALGWIEGQMKAS